MAGHDACVPRLPQCVMGRGGGPRGVWVVPVCGGRETRERRRLPALGVHARSASFRVSILDAGNESQTLMSVTRGRENCRHRNALLVCFEEFASFPGTWAPRDAALEQMDNGDWGYMMTDPVTLNVGGHLYTTSLTTLTRYPDSMLGAMFGGDFPTARDPQGNYFIDRDGPLFRYVLNFLRTSELTLPLDFKEFDLLRKEADFYQIEPLIQCLNDPKPLYPVDTFEEVVELSSTRKLSKYSNPVAVIITQLTITTKVHSLLEGISNYFTKWNKHMMDTRDCQVSFTFGPCDYHQEVSLRVHLMEYITKQGFTIRNTRVHHMSERANENTVEHNWTFCRLARKTDD
ncbi:hypothetical protein JEQ12_008355 [Ovis aries]|uniref:BTB domain-containing protein n=1 Tax=Ovis aries TaxID=9940 RepID=A0A835ZV17_SHEEP|nr:hypothetical protein JEQ12_008355 [Ovis aries]